MTTIEETVGNITDMVNKFSFDQDAFNQAMSREHRTLQQSFTRLCLEWIKHCASEEYRYDLRNQGSHEIAKEIVEKMDNKLHLRMI